MPASIVFENVVVATQGVEVGNHGRSTFGDCEAVVQIALPGWLATPGKDTGRLAGLDVACLGGGRTAASGPVP